MIAGRSGERRNRSTPVRSACSRCSRVRPGERDALLELLLRRAPHRVGRQRADALQRASAASRLRGVEWTDSTSQTNSVNGSRGGGGSAP